MKLDLPQFKYTSEELRAKGMDGLAIPKIDLDKLFEKVEKERNDPQNFKDKDPDSIFTTKSSNHLIRSF